TPPGSAAPSAWAAPSATPSPSTPSGATSASRSAPPRTRSRYRRATAAALTSSASACATTAEPGAARRPGAAARRSADRRRGQRQLDREGRPVARPAVDPHRAAVRVDDLPHDPQAEPEAAEVARGHRPLEALEDALVALRRDPDAAVAHRQ